MDSIQRRHLLLLHQTDLSLAPSQKHIDALRAAVDRTTEELTVKGWSLMQRRIADLYAVAMGRALRNKSAVSVDIVPADFCAYSVDDMEEFKGCTTLVAASDNDNLRAPLPWTTHRHVAVGGTFDHLHTGHKILLTATALATTHRIVCGISADALLENKKHKEFLQSYRTREPGADCGSYGPTATDSTIGALVVSQETLGGSSVLNVRRKENGMVPMELMPVDLITTSAGGKDSSIGDAAADLDEECGAAVSSENTALKVSSTAIRAALAERRLTEVQQQ
ncbi:hypothetical protein BX661DRAFT_198898 [Kickxella alabastrina]|uniref:uncharacterized protein n=1 Tax=Kickxella alabastrina TaxID=61397 RepID=UPI002220E4C4|nr:uncharacterized protein BX661DRAFT_198898 [Kickxella alabastrina]KAI7826284.1 hypothetical protein BX661DRAFT_198898 [Kickxella alabastrina]